MGPTLRSAIRGTHAHPPVLSRCASIHYPRSPVSSHPRRRRRRCHRSGIVHRGSRSSLRCRGVGVDPRPCVLSWLVAEEQVPNLVVVVMATVTAKKRGSKKPFQITPACQHRPRPRPHPHLRSLRHRRDLLRPSPRPHLRPYPRLRPPAQLRARAQSRAACALRRSYSSLIPPMTQTIRRTSASESGGTRVRARINRAVMMVAPEVRLIANSGEECRLVLVVPQLLSQGLPWTKRRTAAAPVNSAEDAKVALAPRREQRGALWQRQSLHGHAPAPCCWVSKTVWGQVEGRE